MNCEEIHAALVKEFGDSKIVATNLEACDPWVEVNSENILEVCMFLRNNDKFLFDSLNNLSGVDYLEPDPKKSKKFEHDPHIEVVYHLYSYHLKHAVVIKAKLPRWKNDKEGELPEIDSVSSVWGIADWHERETYDLVGIRFLGHPNHRRILCPEDWEGHPLRKDYEFPLEYHGIRGH